MVYVTSYLVYVILYMVYITSDMVYVTSYMVYVTSYMVINMKKYMTYQPLLNTSNYIINPYITMIKHV